MSDSGSHNKLQYVNNYNHWKTLDLVLDIGEAMGEQRGHEPLIFLENMVILWLKRRFSKQNRVIRLKSNILAPKIFWPLPNFWAGYATGLRPQLFFFF